MTPSDTLRPRLQRLQRRALLVGPAGVGLCLVGSSSTQSSFSARISWPICSGWALCLAVWQSSCCITWQGPVGLVIRRVLEAGTRPLPLMAVLFVPLLFGI